MHLPDILTGKPAPESFCEVNGQSNSFLVVCEIELLLNLRQQVIIEKCRDLSGFQVHDAVQAKVQIAAVKLKHLAQQCPQSVELRIPGLAARHLEFQGMRLNYS